jgi:hypothetical protein
MIDMSVASWLVPAALSFIGTVAVAALGYYQWRRTDKRRESSDFNKTRSTVLKTLVERLQQLQLLSRSRAGQSVDLDDQVKGLNQFLIDNRLWIEPSEAQLARDYMEALLAISSAMESAPQEDLDIYMVTAEGPYSDNVAGEFRKLARAEEALIRAVRTTLKNS